MGRRNINNPTRPNSLGIYDVLLGGLASAVSFHWNQKRGACARNIEHRLLVLRHTCVHVRFKGVLVAPGLLGSLIAVVEVVVYKGRLRGKVNYVVIVVVRAFRAAHLVGRRPPLRLLLRVWIAQLRTCSPLDWRFALVHG